MPVPRDASWVMWHESLNKQIRSAHPDLVFIGDSLTEHWAYAGKQVWSEAYGSRNAFNLGIGGDQVQHVLWRLINGNIDGIKPKLAVIMAGTNNSGTNTSKQIADGIRAIVQTVRDKLPETRILLLAIFPRGSDGSDALRKVTIGANAIIANLADSDMVEYLDIGPRFLDSDGTLSRTVMHDLLHLTATGYKIWADSIEEHVARHLGEVK